MYVSVVNSSQRLLKRGQSFLIDRPLLLVALLISLFVFLFLAYFVYKSVLRKKSDSLLYLLKSQDSVCILMHEDPDPDAMACALGIERLLDEVDTDTVIRYPGSIRHHENRAMRAVLNLSFENISSADEIEEEETIVVDHHSPRGFDKCEEVRPIAVVDHHEDDYTGNCPYIHIEPEIGSCSTLVTEYLLEQGLSSYNEDGNPEIPPTVSTALFYGIMTDTTNLTQGVKIRDYEAAMSLYQGVDSDKLRRISTPSIDGETLEVKANAIYSMEIKGSFSVSDVGEVQNTDSIPQAVEELVRREGVSAVIVVGESDGVIRFSGRSHDDRVHIGEAIKSSVKDIEGSEAGGHTHMGGGQIPKDRISEEGLTKEDLKERFFECLKGNR